MTSNIRYFYKGNTKDFIVFAESEDAVKSYLKDSTVPLSDAVGNFQIYTSQNGQGSEGLLEQASKQELAAEFDDDHTDLIIPKILREGTAKKGGKLNRKQYESTNDSNGAFSN